MTCSVHRTWAAFLCGYPLLPYLLPTKTAQRHAVLSWYTHSWALPSFNGCSVFTVMRIPIVAGHNKTSSGQSFWLQIQRSRVRFPALPDFSE